MGGKGEDEVGVLGLRKGGLNWASGGARDLLNFKGFRMDTKHTLQRGGEGGTTQI